MLSTRRATTTALCLTLGVTLWSASVAAAPKGKPKAAGVTRGTPAPQLQVDKAKIDLDNHRLEARLSHPPAVVSIKVLSETGEVLAEESHDFTGQAAGSPLEVTWTQSRAARAARIELTAHDVAGGFAGLAVISWSLSIPHEEVVFKTDSSEILDSERPKLEASLALMRQALSAHKAEFGRPTLFIAGHTDTVGSDAYNLRLSQARAQSIARWFLGHGVGIGVAYEGFGETALAVKTDDEVDEARNRRVDYILSIEAPTLRTVRFQAAWKRVN